MKMTANQGGLKDSLSNPEYRPAGFLRRMGAVLYDGLLVAAILIFAHIPLQLLFKTPVVSPEHAWHPIYRIYLVGVCFLYFGWCWTHGGQTLGMRTWRIRVRPQDGNGGRVTWRQVWVRFLSAILSWSVFGLGILWVLVDRERKSWHDRLSGTVLVLVPPRQVK
uniref:Uncharacterized membrane protein YckC, RDD family n=1 Tax=Candidatus Kentrum sp. TUN TaxID=2126343 RepID=A0A450ZWB6_9GAMM|nr:MAG: Uncharacterized membrane protein YckC, RDD family [Candidatus Kentron sp. TUN]VFK60873.1 MAG: Uncharacterized membrane protein YckC, RDD family [Candidatus Kentron sp. TUN]VFK67065.1 MAG: Uncharacterized membrane protein YckC, RDD family [Candidatus Kentron sp. TUN]